MRIDEEGQLCSQGMCVYVRYLQFGLQPHQSVAQLPNGPHHLRVFTDCPLDVPTPLLRP